MEDQAPFKNQNALSNDEKKEKLILDFFYLKSEINSTNGDAKDLREIKKLVNNFEKDLEDLLQIDVPLKNKKDYINLKKTNFDKSLLKLAKFLE